MRLCLCVCLCIRACAPVRACVCVRERLSDGVCTLCERMNTHTCVHETERVIRRALMWLWASVCTFACVHVGLYILIILNCTIMLFVTPMNMARTFRPYL